MFVFGSSLVDNGNNNFQNTTSRADYMPYGTDYPQGPTGRFSNGKNVIDALGDLLHLPSIPAFMNPTTKGERIVHGVDYASGGSGILDETGSVSGNVITLNQQIKNFEEVTLPELNAKLGCARSLSDYLFVLGTGPELNAKLGCARSLSDYLFVLGTGGNDYLLNYFLPTNLQRPGIQVFTANLTQSFSAQIQKLYTLGARKIVLISVYPLGCIPFVKDPLIVNQGCMDVLNQAALLFNTQMKSLVDVLKPKMPGSQLVYVDTYNIILDIMQDPIAKGFSNTVSACCEVAPTRILCNRGGSICGDRRSYVFFDALHPTEAVNELIATKAFSSSVDTEVYPVNVQQLALLQN